MRRREMQRWQKAENSIAVQKKFCTKEKLFCAIEIPSRKRSCSGRREEKDMKRVMRRCKKREEKGTSGEERKNGEEEEEIVSGGIEEIFFHPLVCDRAGTLKHTRGEEMGR